MGKQYRQEHNAGRATASAVFRGRWEKKIKRRIESSTESSTAQATSLSSPGVLSSPGAAATATAQQWHRARAAPRWKQPLCALPCGPGTDTPSPAQGSQPAVTLEDGQHAVGSQVALGVVAELQSLGGAPAPAARTLLGRLRHASGRGGGRGFSSGIGTSTARVSLAAEVGAGGLKGRVLYAVSLHAGTGCEQRRGATPSLKTGGEGGEEGVDGTGPGSGPAGAGAGAGAGGGAFPLLPRPSPAPPRHALPGARTAAAAPEERRGAGPGR